MSTRSFEDFSAAIARPAVGVATAAAAVCQSASVRSLPPKRTKLAPVPVVPRPVPSSTQPAGTITWQIWSLTTEPLAAVRLPTAGGDGLAVESASPAVRDGAGDGVGLSP